MVIVGLFGGTLRSALPLFPFKRLTITGSFAGSPQEFGELLRLAAQEELHPIPISTRPLEEASEALCDLRDGKVTGRTVLVPKSE